MVKYTLSFASAIQHVPEHPERTAYRAGTTDDYTFQVWPSEAAMRTTLAMQARRASRYSDWRAWVDSNMANRVLAAKGESNG